MKRTVTFSQKDLEQLALDKACADAPNLGGSVVVSSSINPGYEDRFTFTPGSFTVTVTWDDDKKAGGAR